MIGKLQAVALDCPEPMALAEFYRQLLGGKVVPESDGWVTLSDVPGGTVLAFQRAENHQPPRWPDPDYPQQLHLDLRVDDLDEAQQQVLALGATLLEGSVNDRGWRVFADPVGHPFCLCVS